MSQDYDPPFEELVPPPALEPKLPPRVFALPPEGMEKKPAWWPDAIEFRGILPNAELEPIEDPAYAHLTQLSKTPRKAAKGERVFPPGLHPRSWLHPNSPLQRMRGAKTRKAAAEQRGDFDETESIRGSREELSKLNARHRALSRLFAEATDEQLKPIMERALKLAGTGDKDALGFVIRMETMLAKDPIDEGKGDERAAESLRIARAEVGALAGRMTARVPESECPFCGKS